ncbi:MAG: hypothetical protein M3384_02820 [Acidobacteriota bacterium]|nr:hypothetical protein [Acidobacteriota bacterium]
MTGNKILLLTMAALALIISCRALPGDTPLIEAQNNNGLMNNDAEICRKINGKWLPYRTKKGKGKEFCGNTPCNGETMGPVELSCSAGKISGRALLGVTSSVKPQQEFWADITGEIKNNALHISYKNEECEKTYRIFEFEENQLFGEVSSNNCKILGENFSYEGDILLLKL